MTTHLGREVRLASRPEGLPKPEDFRISTGEVSGPAAGQVLLRTHWISIDPMIRIMIDAAPLRGSFAPLPLDAVVPGPAAAEVLESAHPDFKPGDFVEGRIGWREYAVVDTAGLRKVGPAEGPLSHAVGVLGLPGFSAYVGLRANGEVSPGQTVLISGAAGAVGSVAGPLAKLKGATVIGIASGPQKCAALVETLGYDKAIDRLAPDFLPRLAEAVAPGVDLYFDNVGGDLFMQVLPLMNKNGRVTICGLMAQYTADELAPGPNRLPEALELIMGRRMTVRAFANSDFPHLKDAFVREVGDLLREGKLPAPEHVTEGIENLPAAFSRLFTHSVLGKSVIRV